MVPERTVPSDGTTGVARDGAIIVEGVASPYSWGCDPLNGLSMIDISLRDDSGAPIPGALASDWNYSLFCSVNGVGLTFVPLAPLAAGAKYELEVVLTPNAGSPVTHQTSFETGVELLAPLEVQGKLEAFGEVVTEVKQQCMQPDGCGYGGGCSLWEHTFLRVTLSGLVVSGGQADDGYDVRVNAMPGSPPVSSGGVSYAHLPAGNVVMTPGIELASEPYAPCLYVSVRDAAGNVAESEATCLETKLWTAPDAGATTNPPASADAGTDAGTSPDLGPASVPASDSAATGCSLKSTNRNEHGVLALASLVVLAGLTSRRSRRPR
jgi:hypothetical protein